MPAKHHERAEHGPAPCAAIILGGGAGSRLYPLTKQRAKPAVPIGGAYRLIDVPMSNCINSGIAKIYILTQARLGAPAPGWQFFDPLWAQYALQVRLHPASMQVLHAGPACRLGQIPRSGRLLASWACAVACHAVKLVDYFNPPVLHTVQLDVAEPASGAHLQYGLRRALWRRWLCGGELPTPFKQSPASCAWPLARPHGTEL